jgi:indole-3-glycerol phosphate synthase
MTILDEIIDHKHLEVQSQQEKESLDSLKQRLAVLEHNNSLRKKMDQNSDFQFICEIKKASPSKGLIQPDFDPQKFASSYQKGGAAAISVLTDTKFFQGNLKYINSVKEIVDLPILRKDFIIDEYQIYESKLYGSDIVLLIARVLSKKQLNEYIDIAAKLNLDVLIEFAEKKEIKNFENTRENVILGINNRNLNTFEVNFQNSLDLKSKLPDNLPIIAESGIKNGSDCAQLRRWGFSGALIGETLMRSANPDHLLQSFISEVRHVDTA